MNRGYFLERITDGQMDAQSIFEAGNVVVPFFTRFVRYMEADTAVYTYDDELEIVAEPYTRAQRQVF